MAPSFAVYPSMSVVRREDFAGTAEISEAFGRHLTSDLLGDGRPPVRCWFGATALAGGVRLSFTSRLDGLAEPLAVQHKFFFIDRDEVRQRLHLVGPQQPEACSELLVMFPDGTTRDYCHASVYDAANRLLAVYSIVFDTQGRARTYPFTARYVSPLALGGVEVAERADAAGRRVLRFRVELAEPDGPQQINLAWEAVGLIHRRSFVCTPEEPAAVFDMPLDGNHQLAAGDWVLIAVDERDGFLAQTLVSLVPAGAPGCPA